MTIQEAIEIKEAQFKNICVAPKEKVAEADRLSIEALKRIQKSRTVYSRASIYSLPGETKD